MTPNQKTLLLVSVALAVVIYFLFFKKKKESSFKVEKYSDADNMKAMMGMGNYGSVLGCGKGKCY